MSDHAWRPKRIGAAKSESKSGSILVELAVTTVEARKALEELIRANPMLSLKQPHEDGVPHVLILEIDEDPQKTFSLVRAMQGSGKRTEVFLTSANTDSKLLLEALRTGMKEFLPQPIQREEVEAAFARFKGRANEAGGGGKHASGKLLVVFGGKGGVGTTSVAVNLAACLHEHDGHPAVALVDINQQGGDIPQMLDMPATHSFRDIAADLSRVDLAFLTSVLSKHESGLHVLPSGYDDLSAGRLNPDCVEATLKLLQSVYEFVVVDCGHVLDLTTKKAMEMSTCIIVVSQLLIPVVHRTKRILELLRGSGIPQEKVCLAITRYVPQDKEVLTSTEEILKHKARWVIPNDYATASAAINNGKPIHTMAPRSALAKSYRELAGAFVDRPSTGSSDSSWITWLPFRKGKRPTSPSAQASL
ncbi:MAG: hypothetical protein D6690_04265 [Nitrospirae bacterium]|nr:MAG: hypothetical protein D6690_04265 [Nitrospirota bacterium]